MTIQAAPGWMGISAKNETGKSWAIEQRVAVGLPATGWYSELGNRSRPALMTRSFIIERNMKDPTLTK